MSTGIWPDADIACLSGCCDICFSSARYAVLYALLQIAALVRTRLMAVACAREEACDGPGARFGRGRTNLDPLRAEVGPTGHLAFGRIKGTPGPSRAIACDNVGQPWPGFGPNPSGHGSKIAKAGPEQADLGRPRPTRVWPSPACRPSTCTSALLRCATRGKGAIVADPTEVPLLAPTPANFKKCNEEHPPRRKK